MRIESYTRLGPYEISSSIGAGGMGEMSKWLATVSILLASCSTPQLASVSEVKDAAGAIVFRDVSVFDGDAMLRHRDVLVRGDAVVALGMTGTIELPAEALELSGAGKTLLPGLVDSHGHLFSAGEKGVTPPSPESIAQAFLYAGVTTVLVAAGFDDETELASAREAGDAIAPHLYNAGPGLTAPGGHPIPLLSAMLPWPIRTFAVGSVPTAADADEARAAVRRIAEELDPPLFKIIFDDLPPGSPHLGRDALEAALDEAHAQGMRPIVHATIPDDVVVAAEAGAALLVHIPQRGVLTEEQVRRLADANVPFVSTLRLISASHELHERGPSALEKEMFGPTLLEPWVEDPAWDLPGFSEEIDDRWEEVAEDTRANYLALAAAGVPIFVGTDSGVHGVFPGASLHHEMRLLVALGMAPVDVLRAVTSAPAEFLEPHASFGRIAPGQRADLLLVRGDPSVDIEALSDIEDVFLDGVRLQRDGLETP